MTSSLIQQFMPDCRMRQIDRIRVRAAPSEAWKIVRSLDARSSLLSRFLFGLREWPKRLMDPSSKLQEALPFHSTIDTFTGPGKGFQILAETPGTEIVIGSAGRFWQANIQWASINSENFRDFSEAGFGKLVWNLRVDPDAFGGSWISWDLRVTSTDDETWKLFRRYWFVIGPFSHWLRRSALKQFARDLGGSPSEENLPLTWDELIFRPKYQKTISTTIEAPPAKVWPWLVQMGCQRAGWYSIDRLDNAGIQSAQQIVPALQTLELGQVLPWRPQGADGFSVLQLKEQNALVLGTPNLKDSSPVPDHSVADTWTFFLEPIGDQATRLITRVRADYQRSWKTAFLNLWVRPAHWIMETAQLRNLKRRIEDPFHSSEILINEAPLAQFRSHVEISIEANPEEVIQAFDDVTPKDMPMAWLLGELRYLPGKLVGKNPPTARGMSLSVRSCWILEPWFFTRVRESGFWLRLENFNRSQIKSSILSEGWTSFIIFQIQTIKSFLSVCGQSLWIHNDRN